MNDFEEFLFRQTLIKLSDVSKNHIISRVLISAKVFRHAVSEGYLNAESEWNMPLAHKLTPKGVETLERILSLKAL